MAANSSLNLIDLDFDSLKNSLRSYLQSQSQFKDYDWEGSNLTVLLDLLAYNTSKNVFFLNMNFAEGFLDTAQLQESVISHAKDLNYTPRSIRSASANVRVDFTATGDSQPYIIQKGASFSTLIKNESFVFSIPESIIVSSVNTTFSFTTPIFEGIYLKDTFIYRNVPDVPRFKISNRNVDTSSITVTVYEDGSVLGKRFIQKTTLLDLDETSEIYFLQSAGNGFYEIIFGDDIIGRRPKENSTIILDYRVSNGSRVNGAKSFFLNFDPTGQISELTDNPSVNTISISMNGANAETIESIRYNAPRHFQTQERTIVPTDYEIALKTAFPEISAVAVFGGEDHVPPLFGRVFVAVDLENINGLPDSKKEEYFKFIRLRSPLKPIFIEPQFTYLQVDSLVRYNQNITTNTPISMKTLIINTINTYNNENLTDFGSEFRLSPFTTLIDETDTSIISNVTEIKIYKKISPLLNVPLNIELDFGIPLLAGYGHLHDRHNAEDLDVISSTPFLYNGTQVELEDDGFGTVRLMRVEGQTHVKITDIGTVDYAKGKIKISNLFINSFPGTAIQIYAVPKDKDIIFPKDTISLIEPEAINVTIEALKQ